MRKARRRQSPDARRIDGPEDKVMVLELDPAFDAYTAKRLRAADRLLLGRRSLDGFRIWPAIADDPDPKSSDAQTQGVTARQRARERSSLGHLDGGADRTVAAD